ncbi:hypothetical protein L6654_43075 [Bradyrhizobium sp. WYCCWR 13023]|uniref:Uncharacterized protein n=1 Tax=Bradyrhizobium zhengyangense TaxID=2911009 RepID=A0A9X1UK14_9BRAD|nr:MULTISPECIES: hypothetical protein [Bradyrhizobium]MCG2633287.1 hypothetical protein [Bradyrhizobium zhengyangense]MCG2645841.1 hypothetical protein [Bradyrhizobium zhengyangense]MCG2672180.1 hypothetical protein [Bradyrhizobium zhengyangense]MDA9519742.1 hypothetical protein [Bradyrhizobium sp. CCBAU 11434]
MTERRQVLPWLLLALVVVLAAGGLVWANREIQTLRTERASHQDPGAEQGNQTAELQKAVQDVQMSQQKLADQLTDLQARLAKEGGERKLLSDQLGSISARVDALASANAESTATTQPARRNPRTKR